MKKGLTVAEPDRISKSRPTEKGLRLRKYTEMSSQPEKLKFGRKNSSRPPLLRSFQQACRMSSTAGDFFRRAAGGVSSTLTQASSSVTSIAQGRKRYDASDDVLEKCTLTIKVGSFCVVSSVLSVLNRRFLCFVVYTE